MLHIVATCSHRKRFEAPLGLRCRDLVEASAEERLAEWKSNFVTTAAKMVRARDLYYGEHWQTVLKLEDVARSYVRPKLWVLSAGFGLIDSDVRIKPYQATFSPHHLDSVVDMKDAEGLRTWWNGLCEWEVDGRSVRSFAELVKQQDESKVMLIASPAYLRAAEEDLSKAIESAPERLVIVSGKGSLETAWAPFTVYSDARLQAKLGGSRQSLGDRVAIKLIETTEGDINVERCRKVTEDLLEGAKSTAPAMGTKLTDLQVLEFIRARLRVCPRSATSLLRELRDSGRSCEQKRFYRLVESERQARAQRN